MLEETLCMYNNHVLCTLTCIEQQALPQVESLMVLHVCWMNLVLKQKMYQQIYACDTINFRLKMTNQI